MSNGWGLAILALVLVGGYLYLRWLNREPEQFESVESDPRLDYFDAVEEESYHRNRVLLDAEEVLRQMRQE